MAGIGSKPGERRGGRQKGTPNKVTADVRALARNHTADAIRELARLASKAESEQARVAAIKELLDRAWGKSTTMVGGDTENPIRTITRIEIVALEADDNGTD